MIKWSVLKVCVCIQVTSCLCVYSKGESKALREQLRQKEEQLQATQQQAAMLSAELRDLSSARDRSMAELYRVKLEADTLRQGQADAHTECSRLEKQVEEMRNSATQEAVSCNALRHSLNSHFTSEQSALGVKFEFAVMW